MSNVSLGELFQDTSDSIRTKIKNQNGIKPINYPNTIGTIQVGVVVPNGTLVNYTPSPNMIGDLNEGMFVNLVNTEVYKNIFNDINGNEVIDSIVVSTGATNNIIILTLNDEALGTDTYTLYKLAVNSLGITVSEIAQVSLDEGFTARRLVKLDTNIFALFSVYHDDSTGTDESLNIQVFDISLLSNNKVYEKTSQFQANYICKYNNHYDGTIGAAATYYNYYVYFTLSTSGGTEAQGPTEHCICDIAIPKDFTTIEVGKEYAALSLGNNAFGGICDPIPVGATYSNKMYVPIVNSANGKIYMIGTGFGTVNNSQGTISDTLLTGTKATVVLLDGDYYLLYSSGNQLRASKLTLTSTNNGTSTTVGSSSEIANISSLSLRKEKIQMISNDKGIITFNSTTAPNELKYATLSKSSSNFITCSTAHTLGDHVNEGNFIDIIPNNLCVGISHNFSNNEVMARVYTQTNANGSLSTNSCYVATPSSSTIDGITKTEAAQGAIGQAYILNTGE